MEDDKLLLQSLSFLHVADMDRSEWITVGMALKEKGYPCSVWDEWSRADTRYKKGECERLWNGFKGASKPVKAGTVIQMAKDRGWVPELKKAMDWDDEISYDGVGGDCPMKGPSPEISTVLSPAEQLIMYLETLFKPSDCVSFVTGDVYENEGRWSPGKGRYNMTQKQIIAGLKKHPDDLGATIGDWKKEAGAWIRFNPVDGKGIKNENITAFRYALVESDTLPLEEQETLYRKYELPIAALVYSGGKSLHAIVRVDAKNAEEYRSRVNVLYDFLEQKGVTIDRQNSNPSRLSRLPGVTRNGKIQCLEAVNIGRSSWNDWMDYVEGVTDELPPIETFADYMANPPKLKEPLIEGVLRQGHKMIVTAPSKAGKSMLLQELALCIAEGLPWLNFQVKPGKVLYINLEIDKASVYYRLNYLVERLRYSPKYPHNLEMWNLRGCAKPLDELVPIILRRVRDQRLSAIILDPIYKVITGDENNASEMAYFCNQFDRICTELECAMIFCHHHSKGAQGYKKSIDRASGSGVFGRDPDAILDLTELEMTDDIRNNVRDGMATAWRLEGTLREFAPFPPKNIWFDFPLHYVDTSGRLDELSEAGSPIGNLAKSGKRNSTAESRRTEFDNAFEYCAMGEGSTSIMALAKYLGISERTARERVNEYSDYYQKLGSVFKIEQK